MPPRRGGSGMDWDAAVSMDTKEMVHCILQIEKMCAERSYEDTLTILGDLDKLHISAEQLETTNIVKVLYRLLKTCSNRNVNRTVKHLLSKWKQQYSKDVKSREERADPESPSRISLLTGGASHEAGDDDGDSHSGSTQNAENPKTASEQEARDTLQTGLCSADSESTDFSSIRSKCVELLLAALNPDPPGRHKAAQLAADIEKHINKLHTSNQAKYKACVRSKVANLRNPKNGHLGQGLLGGSLSPEAFARMSVEEMAGAELRQLRQQYSSRGVSERQLPQGAEGAKTHKIRCKRCGATECTVTQVSRGALFLPAWVRRGGPDEDAMTFVTCSVCGQQWYHSNWVCL